MRYFVLLGLVALFALGCGATERQIRSVNQHRLYANSGHQAAAIGRNAASMDIVHYQAHVTGTVPADGASAVVGAKMRPEAGRFQPSGTMSAKQERALLQKFKQMQDSLDQLDEPGGKRHRLNTERAQRQMKQKLAALQNSLDALEMPGKHRLRSERDKREVKAMIKKMQNSLDQTDEPGRKHKIDSSRSEREARQLVRQMRESKDTVDSSKPRSAERSNLQTGGTPVDRWRSLSGGRHGADSGWNNPGQTTR